MVLAELVAATTVLSALIAGAAVVLAALLNRNNGKLDRIYVVVNGNLEKERIKLAASVVEVKELTAALATAKAEIKRLKAAR